MGAKLAKSKSDRINRNVTFNIDDQDQIIFANFAQANFNPSITNEFTKQVLDQSILRLNSIGDEIAALAVWITILRFMGDLSDENENNIQDKNSIINHVDVVFQKNFSKSDLKNAQRYSRILEKQIKLEKQKSFNPFLLKRTTTFLEKLHLVTSIGILRPELRDEIFCQICKQLTNNENKVSKSRGWILLSLCLGCFAPSNQFVNYLISFIKKGPSNYSKYCYVRLKRTLANGARSRPPSWLELRAAKSNFFLSLPITFIDGSKETIIADSATTSKELVDALSRKLNIAFVDDFTVNIGIYDQMTSLGYNDNHIMDAISECEQYAKFKTGIHERNAPWKLFVNRELIINPDLIYYEDYLVNNLPITGAEYGETHC